MYSYMYRFLELFGITCHSLAILDEDTPIAKAVKKPQNLAQSMKKALFLQQKQGFKIVGGIGLEPTTPCVSSGCSSQLS